VRSDSLSSDAMPLNDEDLIEIERNGRRCGVCRSGRRWRDFEVLREEGREPMVMCPACHARHGQTPTAHITREVAKPSVTQPPVTQPTAPQADHQPVQREDRLKKALSELPRGEYATARIAKAAGLNHDKALARLQQLQATGEVRQGRQPLVDRTRANRPRGSIRSAPSPNKQPTDRPRQHPRRLTHPRLPRTAADSGRSVNDRRTPR
jgi:hypothetical protein